MVILVQICFERKRRRGTRRTTSNNYHKRKKAARERDLGLLPLLPEVCLFCLVNFSNFVFAAQESESPAPSNEDLTKSVILTSVERRERDREDAWKRPRWAPVLVRTIIDAIPRLLADTRRVLIPTMQIAYWEALHCHPSVR